MNALSWTAEHAHPNISYTVGDPSYFTTYPYYYTYYPFYVFKAGYAFEGGFAYSLVMSK